MSKYYGFDPIQTLKDKLSLMQRVAAKWEILDDKARTTFMGYKQAIDDLENEFTITPIFLDGQPCKHPGCQAHQSHACEGCGRIGCKGVVVLIVPKSLPGCVRLCEFVALAAVDTIGGYPP